MSIVLNKRGYLLLLFIVCVVLYYNFYNKTPLVQNNDKLSLIALLQTAIQASEAGGHFVLSVKNGDYKIHSKGKTEEGLQDSVTDADFLSHCSMKNVILTRFPLVKFISEEKVTNCENVEKFRPPLPTFVEIIDDEHVNLEDVTVWIDPLDATKEYTEGLYHYVTTMVCVAFKGVPIIGVIHNPFENSTYWAVVGKGYSGNLSSKKKRDSTSLKVIISRSHSGNVEEQIKRHFKDAEVITAAGSGYKVLKVAKNDVDAYIHTTAIKKWDICAGNAILNALGGKMTTKNGKLLTYADDTNVVNKDGLIATLRNHNLFVNKL